MTQIRELSSTEIETVNGAALPVVAGYYALRVGGGALVGAGIGIGRELAGDGLQWSDAGSIGGHALAGASIGGGGGMLRHASRLLNRF